MPSLSPLPSSCLLPTLPCLHPPDRAPASLICVCRDAQAVQQRDLAPAAGPVWGCLRAASWLGGEWHKNWSSPSRAYCWYQVVPCASRQGRGGTSSGTAGTGGAEMQLFKSCYWTSGSYEQEPDFLLVCTVLRVLVSHELWYYCGE